MFLILEFFHETEAVAVLVTQYLDEKYFIVHIKFHKVLRMFSLFFIEKYILGFFPK